MRLPVFVASLLAAAVAPALAGTAYPLKLENCGATVEVKQPPKHALAFKSSAADALLALGLADRVAGVGFLDGPLPEASGAAAISVLSDKLPSQEVVLGKEPDFIYGGWESVFGPKGVGERAFFDKLGVATYVSPSACRSVKPPRLTFDAIFAEIDEIGKVFDVEPAAEKLIAEQKAQISGIKPDTRGLSALWYSSGTKTPYVGAGDNAPALVLQTLGLKNIYADVNDGWTSASWEAIADANPDVIVLVDAAWNSVAQKKKLLSENPVTSKMEAVKNGRYLVIDFPASQAGVRTAPAAVEMAGQLRQIVVPGR